jgi:hypothetical protein
MFPMEFDNRGAVNASPPRKVEEILINLLLSIDSLIIPPV